MTPDEARTEAERRILSSLAASIVATARKVAAEHGLPTEATATALISPACFLAEEEDGRANGCKVNSKARVDPGELASTLN